MKALSPTVLRNFKKLIPHCAILDQEITSLSDYLNALEFAKENRLWVRGHADCEWRLVPGALRFKRIAKREGALESFREFRRRLEAHMDAVQQPIEFGWMQRAQHYGLPTRLLDWTEKLNVGLYFACTNNGRDGAVFVLDPRSLNLQASLSANAISPEATPDIVAPYLALDGRLDPAGPPTIAVTPCWNNPRIDAQGGAFTLHGSNCFQLDGTVASSLMAIPVRRKHKKQLLKELHSSEVHEASLFPEAASVCKFLRRELRLEGN